VLAAQPPPPDGAVVAGTDDLAAIRGDEHRVDTTPLSAQHEIGARGLDVVQAQRRVEAARDDLFAPEDEVHSEHRVLGAFDAPQLTQLSEVPQPLCAILCN